MEVLREGKVSVDFTVDPPKVTVEEWDIRGTSTVPLEYATDILDYCAVKMIRKDKDGNSSLLSGA